MSHINNQLIFLTGCINPENMSYTKLNNLDLRKKHYILAIKFYLTHTTLPILFVENSGIDISDQFDKEVLDKRLEILTFYGNGFDKSLGKGYGEMIIFDYAFLNSRYIREADFIFKITGRHRLLNINRYIKFISNNSNCDLLVDLTKSLTWADSRFFGFKKHFFVNYLSKFKVLVNDTLHFYFENALAKASLQAINCNIVYYPFLIYPKFLGISGTDAKKINSNFFFLFPRFIKYFLKFHILLR